MPILATFTLRDPADWRGVVELVRQHAGPMASQGTPLRVMVAKKLAIRALVLNAFMWADVLEAISRQARVAGRWHSAESWHQEMKMRHLPEVNANGMEKWRYYADGSRDLVMGTGDLDGEEFSEYLLAVQGDAAAEYGVVFDAHQQIG